MKVKDFLQRLEFISDKIKTVYVPGCNGYKVNEELLAHLDNRTCKETKEKLTLLIGDEYYAFDNAGLIKSIIWGWNDKVKDTFSQVNKGSNCLSDLSARGLYTICFNKSGNFETIQPGVVLWDGENIGVYLGKGLAIMCSNKSENAVVTTTVTNLREGGIHRHQWISYGYFPYVEYDNE